jgi:hypothetical protein
MKVSTEINSKNKSGIEIESYPNGLVVDIGYRMGNSPTTNKKATVTITDKNKMKCNFPNSEFHEIDGDSATLIYRTDASLHTFLAKKCPNLDISDLIAPHFENLKAINDTKMLGNPPTADANPEISDSSRSAAHKQVEELIKHLEVESSAIQK